MSAGALSMYRLWEDLSINVAIRKYINMFGLRITLDYNIYIHIYDSGNNISFYFVNRIDNSDKTVIL